MNTVRLSGQEKRELQQRHSAALRMLARGVPPDRRELLLSHVIWPTDAILAAQRSGRLAELLR